MTDWREDLLTAILDCGYGDLYLMKDCQYDIGEIVEECIATFGSVKINDLVRIMFDHGLFDIDYAISERIEELDDKAKTEGELDETERIERDALESLEPYSDIQSHHNFVDTYIWIDAKEKVPTYTKYMQDALDDFEEMTGFSISVW